MAGVLDAFVLLSRPLSPHSGLSPVALHLLERMLAIGRAPDTSAWIGKEWDIELGLEIKEWEDGRERETHIGSLWECVLNGCNPSVRHFIKELMTFGSS